MKFCPEFLVLRFLGSLISKAKQPNAVNRNMNSKKYFCMVFINKTRQMYKKKTSHKIMRGLYFKK